MKFKLMAVASLLGLSSIGAQANVNNWGVHDALELGANFHFGAFTDYFFFQINPGANTVVSAMVANNLDNGAVLNISNGHYSLWNAGADSLLGGAGINTDSQVSANFSFNGTTGNLTNSLKLSEGNYFYKVTGLANGASGGVYLLTSALVPEPQTYALLLAGLGFVGVVARRRNAAR